MKKNTTMRIAALLFVAVLMTTCVISGSFAKYVTSGSVSDSARVAKFGVTVNTTSDLFSQTYAKDDTTFTVNANSVSASAKVVAPGTEGDITSASLSGTPEVAVRVSYDNVDLALTGWTVSSAYYCPLVITVNSTDIDGADYTSAAAFEAAVEDAIEDVTNDYAAGTNLATGAGSSALSVSWSWPFEVSGNDDEDTALGNAVTAPTVALSYDMTVTQID